MCVPTYIKCIFHILHFIVIHFLLTLLKTEFDFLIQLNSIILIIENIIFIEIWNAVFISRFSFTYLSKG